MDLNKRIAISAEDCVQVKDWLFFISKEINIICSLNMNNGEISIVDSIPEEDILNSRLGSKIINWRDYLVFAPMSAKKIWRYNLETKEWKGYERRHLGDGKTGDEMFQAVLYHDAVFIIGSNYPAIIRLDLQSEELTYFEEPYKILEEKRKEYRDCYFRSDCVQIDNYIYLASALDNLVLRFDMQKLDFEWIRVGNEGNRYSGISWDGKDFWLAPRYNTPIVKWNGKDNCKEYVLPALFSEKKLYFLGVICTDEEIVFPGFLKPFTVVISRNGKDELNVKKEQYNFYKKISDDVLVKFYNDNIMQIVHSGGEIRKYCIQIDRDILTEYLERKKVNFDNNTKVFYEGEIVNLDFFCRNLTDNNTKSDSCKDNPYGGMIWSNIRNWDLE